MFLRKMLSDEDKIIKKLLELAKKKESNPEAKNINVKELPAHDIGIEDWNKVRGIIESRKLLNFTNNDQGTFLRYNNNSVGYLKYLQSQEEKEIEHEIKKKELNFQERQLKIQEDQTEIFKKQIDIQNKQSDTINRQEKILKSTFWIYSVMAIVMLFQLMTDYLYNLSALNSLNKIMVAIGLIIVAITFALIWENIKLPLGEKINIYQKIVIFFSIGLFLITLILVGYTISTGDGIDQPPLKISGEIKINDLEKILSITQNKSIELNVIKTENLSG